MNRNDFVKMYENIVLRALYCSKKEHREGILALEEEIIEEKVEERDMFEYGLHFVIDGIDKKIIEKILSNIIKQETDEQMKIIKTIQKEAVLMLEEGLHPILLYALLNSYTDIALKDDEMKKIIE
jgi:flagellar motor component MotA